MGDGEETWTVLPCTWNGECKIDGGKDKHHRLFQEEKVAPRSMEGKADTPVTEKNKSSTCETVQRTWPEEYCLAYYSSRSETRERRLQVNCLLDEGSDCIVCERGCGRGILLG